MCWRVSVGVRGMCLVSVYSCVGGYVWVGAHCDSGPPFAQIMLFVLERTLQLLPAEEEQLTWVLDFKGFSRAHLDYRFGMWTRTLPHTYSCPDACPLSCC